MANLGNDARPNWALDPDNKVLAKIDSYLNVGKMDIDGSDRHDVIVWLYGLDNWQKKGFLEDVTTGAYDFVSSLKSGDATEKRKYKKKLLTYKQNAQASAREILSKETGWLFADGKAAAIYKTNRDEGRDPNFGTITDSVEDQKHGGDANVPVVSPKDAANANAAAAIDFTKNDDIDGSDIDIDGDDEDEELAPPALDSIIPSSGEITVPELKKKKSKKGKKSKKSKSGQNGTPKITLKNIEDLLGAYETNGDEGLAGWNIGHNQVQQLYDFYTQNQDSVTQDVIDTIVNEYRTE
jgi:hypothetical protein